MEQPTINRESLETEKYIKLKIAEAMELYFEDIDTDKDELMEIIFNDGFGRDVVLTCRKKDTVLNEENIRALYQQYLIKLQLEKNKSSNN